METNQEKDGSDNEVDLEVPGIIRVYKNGTVDRLLVFEVIPPSIVPVDGVSSKDIIIKVKQQAGRSLSARIFLPDLVDKVGERLPLFLHFHGGGFFIGSPSAAHFHGFLAMIAAKAHGVVLSVDYRLAPEHPIPAAYEDSWETLMWAAEHRGGTGPECWLNDHVDFGKLFLGGESSGANIAHNMAMMARSSDRWAGLGLSISGLVLIHPYFWGSEPIGSESLDLEKKALCDKLWPFVCPSSPSNDDPRVNPVADRAPSLAGLGCQRVLVCVAEKDILRDRGWLYYNALGRSGWKGAAVMFESEGEDHVFHLIDSGSQNARRLSKRIVGFLNGDRSAD